MLNVDDVVVRVPELLEDVVAHAGLALAEVDIGFLCVEFVENPVL